MPTHQERAAAITAKKSAVSSAGGRHRKLDLINFSDFLLADKDEMKFTADRNM